MRVMLTWTMLLVLSLTGIAGAQDTLSGLKAATLTAADDGSLGRLIPQNAAGVLWINSIDGFREKLAAAGKLFGAEQDARGMVEMILMELGPLGELVDPAKPFAMAFTVPEDGQGEPEPIIIAPVTDLAKLQEMMPGATVVGSYTALSQSKVTPSATPSPLVKGLPQGDLVLRLDLVPIIKAYGAFADMGLGMLPTMVPDGTFPGMDMEEVAEFLGQSLAEFKASAQMLDVTVNLKGDVALLDGELRFKPESSLAKATAQYSGNGAALTRALVGGYQIAGSLSFGMDKLAAFVTDLSDEIMEMAPFGEDEDLMNLMKEALDLMKYMDGGMAMGANLTPQGMGAVAIMDMKDPDAYIKKYMELLKHPSIAKFGVTAKVAPDRMVGDVAVHTISATFSEKFWDNFANPEMPPEMMQSMMDRLYGKGGMTFTMAGAGKTLVSTFGPDAGRIDQVLAAVKSGKGTISPDLAAALKRAGRAPAFVGAADINKLVAEAIDMVQDIAPEGELPEMPDFSNLRPAMGTMYAGSDPGNWKFGMSIDLAGLSDLIKKFDEM